MVVAARSSLRPMDYGFDRFLHYDELVDWLRATAAAHPELVTLDAYGTSNEGRDLWLATITDPATGTPDAKPAQSILSVVLIDRDSPRAN